MTTLLRIAAVVVATIVTAWPAAAHLGDPAGRTAPVATPSTIAASDTSLPWSGGHQTGTGELHRFHLDRLEASLTRLYAMR